MSCPIFYPRSTHMSKYLVLMLEGSLWLGRLVGCGNGCYDMEVAENCVTVFYGTERREGERLQKYTRGIGPCSSTVYET